MPPRNDRGKEHIGKFRPVWVWGDFTHPAEATTSCWKKIVHRIEQVTELHYNSNSKPLALSAATIQLFRLVDPYWNDQTNNVCQYSQNKVWPRNLTSNPPPPHHNNNNHSHFTQSKWVVPQKKKFNFFTFYCYKL